VWRRALWVLVLLTRSFPSFPGRWRVIGLLWRHRQALSALPPFQVSVGHLPGYIVEYGADESFGVYVDGLSRRSAHHGLPALLQPGDTVLDIGASIGHTTVSYAVAVGPSGRVHAFEPSPDVLPRLRTNVQRNGLTNIDIYAVAVSDREGTVDFHMPGDGSSALSSMRPLLHREARRVRVPSLTIDSLLPRIGRVSFVKIDVEGAELLVLRGMRGLIERDRPAIMTEVTDDWLGALGGSAQAVCDLLRAAQYVLYKASSEGLSELGTPPREQFELLALPRERAMPSPVVPSEVPSRQP
jgi:FkbM family methyltransferase